MSKAADIDINGKGSFHACRDMIFSLCGRQADISYDTREISDGFRMTTLDVRMDNPQDIQLPEQSVSGEVRRDSWKNGAVYVLKKGAEIPDQEEENAAWVIREDGLSDSIYGAFLEIVRVVDSLKLNKEFAWGSVILPPPLSDREEFLKRKKLLDASGAVHTFWVREESDDKVKEALKTITASGEVRVQNMVTANTWITGKIDVSEISKLYQR